jgi:NADPH-dependent 2,4-dienoyl-CoA reductase/sulfur reductase-like enzyme/Fe-S-cluster-containing hydrogenase component 2/bacterioferritin-associated ferredoxin
MENNRIDKHPILAVPEREDVLFTWNGKPLAAKRGEMISSALIANGINVFGHHHKDGSAQGIFCANGQCAKCTVIAEGVAVKSCMTMVKQGMEVRSAEGLPELPGSDAIATREPIEHLSAEVLIIGGGPSGLAAAIELGKHHIDTLLIDDKHALGGKLVLQTHKFFGSEQDSNAGVRGHDIGKLLSAEVAKYDSVKVWLNSTALFVFSDQKVGILKDGVYKIVTPKRVLNAAGAREKFLRFTGNHLARIYGAGAFQTLVNRDLIRPTNRLFIIGGGNVGLIAGYHALQAGIEVVGLAEAMPQCGGYKVHADKLKRLGVPIYTSHSILSANGGETVESVTIAQVDDKFRPIPGTEKSFNCDTILIAVGLDSLSEFTQEAREAGLPVYAAGDALEIAEASSAMFNGKIAGLTIVNDCGHESAGPIPAEWYAKAEVLKSHPGAIKGYQKGLPESGVFPVIHCLQEIPCNPCTTVCPTNSINTEDGGLMALPQYTGSCIGCYKCLLICPGLAITLVDFRQDAENPTVTMPYEVFNYPVQAGGLIEVADIDGNPLGKFSIAGVADIKQRHTQLVKVKVPKAIARQVASFRVQAAEVSRPLPEPILPERLADDAMVCLCERVSAGEVRKLIREGISDLNQLKAVTRAGMGPCGAKTCETLIKGILREEGIPTENVVPNTKRPVFVEVALDKFPDGDC